MNACVSFLGGINYLAVLVCTIIAMMLGALWYSKLLFGSAWMKGVGLTDEDIKGGSPAKAMIVSAITSFIEALVLASIIKMTQTATLGMGIHIGALVSIGFIATVTLSTKMFDQGNLKVWGINSAYRVVYFIINGGILAAWQ